MLRRLALLGTMSAFVVIAIGACNSAAPATLTPLKFQLKWVTQAQFAGYYAAADQGYYKDAGLDVKIKVGGPNITPETVVVGGGADLGLDWLPNLFATDEKGGGLVSVAQVFARSGMTEITWKSSGVDSIVAMKGKKVGVWCCGNQPELYAALTKNGIDPTNKSDVTIVNQPFDMNLFLNRQVDAASAMTYNELAQVLETKNPKTGKLYQLSDLNVLKMEDQGTGMLEDGVFATGKWLAKQGSTDIAKRFLAASFDGWAYCRDNYTACVDTVLKNGPTLGKGHQTWMMNEINALIWPAPNGIGVMDAAAFDRTAKIAQDFKVIKKPATKDAYRTDLAQAGVDLAKKDGTDVSGSSWKKADVKVTAGGA